jgi:hypothetical protein
VAIALAAKQLSQNTKNPAFTNPAFTGASHFAGIPKSGKIPKIRHSQGQLT